MSWFSSSIISFSILVASTNHLPESIEYDYEHDKAQQLVASGTIISLDKSLQWLGQFCYGQLIDVRLIKTEGTWLYAVEMQLVNGKEIDVRLNATNDMNNSISQLPSECIQNETVTR
ncbi:PepSY domain-containing protein [Shewanella intestini]|uniref:PepSY domain-containing protein n=1 Tax=Shewanella intestini TaxID=2017544 RepID=A0ABS5I112_9GAMM|nr:MULTISPECIES: hypothetical protein [Shewanella]MBR9727704.1 hypothetical protein [Shewanella intestini]MRG35146.1 hypothetical protein [Shewanella sp. XMDDZSB0408]